MKKFRVGLNGDQWRLITDGISVYECEDVRWNHTPPHLPSRKMSESTKSVCDEETYDWIVSSDIEMAFAEALDSRKRIIRLLISQSALDDYCKSNGYQVKETTHGLKSWFSPFSEADVAEIFFRVERDYNGWIAVDKQLAEIKQERKKSYRLKAENEWRQFYKLKSLSSVNEMDGREFELAIAQLYETMGYSVTVTKATGDFGVDVIACKGDEKLAIQTKRYGGKVGVKAIQEVASGGRYYNATKAMVITNSMFTDQAKELSVKIGVVLVDKKKLATMWERHQPNVEIPKFNLDEYELIKRSIKKELSALKPKFRSTW
jgi:restriction system protein